MPDPNTGIIYSEGYDGWYQVPFAGTKLRVIASDGLGWDHVSVSLSHRCPTWEEMAFVKSLFFKDDEAAMELHVPVADHKNVHRFCLHLWRPQECEIPRPPSIMV